MEMMNPRVRQVDPIELIVDPIKLVESQMLQPTPMNTESMIRMAAVDALRGVAKDMDMEGRYIGLEHP